jgi:uroporphyrin-III C-methyltransferase/precorrin-2 dehydrogenase/sirohydrochlorin ferrochelatase
MAEPELFPVFLKLSGRSILVVGAGPVGSSKVAGLLPTGATITVVAPEVSAFVEQSGVEIVRREFQEQDLDGRWLVVSAAPPEVNRVVAAAAERRRLFVNAVDDPPNATAYLGGVVRRSGVTVAISTSGRAPALAGLLREGLEAMLPGELDEWLEHADALRKRWRDGAVPMSDRRPELVEAIVGLYYKDLQSRS